MSDYAELQQFVGAVSDEAQQDAYLLTNCADNIERLVASFDRLTKQREIRPQRPSEFLSELLRNNC